MAEEEEFRQISIPVSFYKDIEERIVNTGFSSVDSYVAYVLKEVLTDDEEEEVFSKEDEEKVKDRLRALGYLD